MADQFLENLAKGKKEETLKAIGRRVVEDYNIDKGSREMWDDRVKEWYKLFSGQVDKKTDPWENSSNVNIPLLNIASLQFQARAYEALLPPKEILKCRAIDGEATDTAKRCQKFMNWQVTEQMEEWPEDMDILLLMLPIYGVGVKKTYFDPVLNRNVSKTLRVDEFVAPYGVKRLEDAPRKTHCYEEYLNNIKKKGRDGIWLNTEEIENIQPSPATDRPAQEHRDTADEVSGTQKSSEDRDLPRLILEQHRNWDLDGDGIEEPYIITVDKETEKVLRIDDASFIDPITGVEKAFNHFTAYTFIPNPDSWMGFGFGHLMEHLNHATNSLINQLIDSGTLSNTICGFVNGRSGLKQSDLEMDMGMFKYVDLPADDVSKAIYQFKFNPPSNVLFTLLSMLQDYAKELSSVSDAMLGQLPPSDTTATTMLAVMEQGLKVFSTIHRRTHRGLKKEAQKLAALNALYVDEFTYRSVQDSTSEEMKTYESAQADFSRITDVIPLSDPTITSRAEMLIRARQAYEIGMQDPDIQADPEARYWLKREYYEALEVKNIDRILKLPEPQEPPDLRPEQEEAEFLKEQGVQPLPEQDHAAHLLSHEAFKESGWAEQLTPQGKKVLDAHILETKSLLYLAQRELIQGDIENGEFDRGIQGLAEQPVSGEFTGEAGVPQTELGAGFSQ
jgi:chaperonin GroES